MTAQPAGPRPEPVLEPAGRGGEHPFRNTTDVIVVGGGLVGVCCAWLLQHRGHRVVLIDPADPLAEPAPTVPSLSGTQAALGVLMAQVSHRPRGRAWRLRQRGLSLWKDWRPLLAAEGLPIPWREGLLLLAADAEESQRQTNLAAERQAMGLPVAVWGPERLEALHPAPPHGAISGLFSAADGQLDPAAAQTALLRSAKRRGLLCRRDAVVALESCSMGWRVVLRGELSHGDGSHGDESHGGGSGGNGSITAATVVVAAGTASGALLNGLEAGIGSTCEIEPVLGQALELELAQEVRQGQNGAIDWNWPGALLWRGTNLVPRPDLPGGSRLWMGATLEPGEWADPQALANLANLHGAAPTWLRQARVARQWQGLRARPLGQPAPLLDVVAPGLLLASGHYRNGVLLAPASAEWVCQQVESST